MAELFGFRFTRIKDENKGSEKITPPTSEDGTIMLLVVVSLVKFLTQRVEKEQRMTLSDAIVILHNNQSAIVR